MISSGKAECPVCGMMVRNGQYALEHQKMFFHFCSEQCRDTFQARPGLYIGQRAKECGEIIKHRRLRLAEAPDPDTSRVITECLQASMGVKDCRLNGRFLAIRYDLLQVTLAQVERALGELRVTLDNGWWPRFRRAWSRDTEQNELDNLASPPSACCNRPPPRA